MSRQKQTIEDLEYAMNESIHASEEQIKKMQSHIDALKYQGVGRGWYKILTSAQIQQWSDSMVKEIRNELSLYVQHGIDITPHKLHQASKRVALAIMEKFA